MLAERFNNLQAPLANKVTAMGDEYLYFGGTAYLGIPQNEKFFELYLEGLQLYGLNNGTSRANNVQLAIYQEAELAAAERFAAPAALLISSGYLAAQLTIKNLVKFGEVRYAPQTHPALWENIEPSNGGAFSAWAKDIVEEINTSTQENWVIISNSMNNLYPEIYDFSFVRRLKKQVLLIIDDSHGIGITNQGLGAFTTIPKQPNLETVVVASMAKALGVDAGIILGSSKMITQLKQTHEFLGASPPAAAGLFAFKNGATIYQEALSKLMRNMNLLHQALAENNDWHFITDFPVYFCKITDLSERLSQQNILVSSFPYPDKDGPIINRIVLCSWHTDADIKKLIKALP